MGQTPEDIYTLAKRFFEQDYHDRGMVKWQGYYLSDHTEDVAQYTAKEIQRADQVLQEKQTPEELGMQLKTAYEGQLDVTIQLTTKDETGMMTDLVTGKVVGYTESNDIILGDTIIPFDTINWCEIQTY